MKAFKLRGQWLFAMAAATALFLGQISSLLVERHLLIGESARVFSNLHFTHVRNFGGIFGLFQGHGWWFAAVSVVVLSLVIGFVIRNKHMKRLELLCFGVVVGGGLSNITDRLLYGSVIDFIDVRGIPHWHYVFNTADLMIHLGVWPLLMLSLFASHAPSPSKADES